MVSFVESLHALLEDWEAAGHDIAVSYVESPHTLLELLEVSTKLAGEDLVDGHRRSGINVLSGKVWGLILGQGGGLGTASTLDGFLDHRLRLGLGGYGRKFIARVGGGGTLLLHPSVSFVTTPLSSHR